MKKEPRKSQFKSFIVGLTLPILPTVAAFLLEAVAFFAYLSITAIYKGATSTELVDAGPMFLVKYLLFLIIFGWIYLLILPDDDKSDSKLPADNKAGSKVLLPALAVIAIGALLGFINLELYKGADETTLFTAIVMITLGALGEEILFRGLTFSIAKKFYTPVSAIIIQALLYGVFQMNLIQGLMAAIIGILLGFIKEKKDSLILCILLHMSMNAVFYLF
ncbi:MAG: CPBP family intramembrane metalloprotease [Eubacterium sp.]|nr:CPBP family intramembrane metalloprotease [Eubacterium sp.]